jgi:DNA-binding MarR family transcriptional regulator
VKAAVKAAVKAPGAKPASPRGAPGQAKAAPRLPIDSSLFFKLIRLVNLTARPFVEGLARSQALSLSEWRAMVVLASHPGAAAHEVAEHTGLDKMSVSRAIAALGSQGRVLKTPDPADARRVQLRLSAAGRRLFEAIGQRAAQRELQLFSSLGPQEQQLLEAAVDKLVAALVVADQAPSASQPTSGLEPKQTGLRRARKRAAG